MWHRFRPKLSQVDSPLGLIYVLVGDRTNTTTDRAFTG
jgi:hypothetical protein